mmetsp:Transcript_27482/g.59153  ORF Transcript_27482/g.59153 Transcript_27482/m.59153 type:complete len:200 (+) Transcript_27482:83-682(+)
MTPPRRLTNPLACRAGSAPATVAAAATAAAATAVANTATIAGHAVATDSNKAATVASALGRPSPCIELLDLRAFSTLAPPMVKAASATVLSQGAVACQCHHCLPRPRPRPRRCFRSKADQLDARGVGELRVSDVLSTKLWTAVRRGVEQSEEAACPADGSRMDLDLARSRRISTEACLGADDLAARHIARARTGDGELQ